MQKFARILSFLTRSHALAATFLVLILFPWDMIEEGRAGEAAHVIWTKMDDAPQPMALEFDPITEVEAIATNSAIPFSTAPLEAARSVNLLSASYTDLSQSSALECMASAIYHEAGYEPIQGRRAVAQVVLNRVKHPAFPNTVCDVVYQGSERATGCQFTFTCDGSLSRSPPAGAWTTAKSIASDALSGGVEASVGMATHYHANYVVPYWAPSLDKVAVIGSHIFYKWKGSYGRRAAFTQIPLSETLRPDETYGKVEFAMPDLGFDQPDAQVGTPPSPILADRTLGLPKGPANNTKVLPPKIAADAASGQLLEDEKSGSLLLDGGSTP